MDSRLVMVLVLDMASEQVLAGLAIGTSPPYQKAKNPKALLKNSGSNTLGVMVLDILVAMAVLLALGAATMALVSDLMVMVGEVGQDMEDLHPTQHCFPHPFSDRVFQQNPIKKAQTGGEM